MKKYNYLLLIFLSIFTLTACASQSQPPAMKLAKFTAVPNSAIENVYTNEKLSFSFVIPNSWEAGNYSSVATSDTMDDGTKYTKVDFIFQADTDNSLLSIQIVPKTWWDKAKKTEEPKFDYLGTKGDSVYCCTLPTACPYEVGTKADLYNSMAILHDDVPKRFKIIGDNPSSSSGVSLDTIQNPKS